MATFSIKNCSVYLRGQVFNPTNLYSGQKLIKLVSTKIAAIANNTYATIPSTMPCQYNTAITMAIKTLIIRSVPTMFLFIIAN